MDTLIDLGWMAVFAFVGGVVGLTLVLAGSAFLPRLINRLTPEVDEAKEIAAGNRAVADYFGRVVGAAVIGMSIVVAAAVLGGILAALH